jgi:ABC-2 type transport system ATP-binding protein
VALVAALASNAELLILDEPTSGLDPLMEAVFQDCIHEVKLEGRTVLLSSHILAEVEALCDRVSIIRLGRMVQSGTLDELRHLTRTSITAEVDGATTALKDVPGLHDLVIDDGTVRFDVDQDHLDETVRTLGELGVRRLVSHPPTLEELFLRHYGDELSAEHEHRGAR